MVGHWMSVLNIYPVSANLILHFLVPRTPSTLELVVVVPARDVDFGWVIQTRVSIILLRLVEINGRGPYVGG